MIEITLDNVDEVFAYHAPTPEQVERMNAMRESAKETARSILLNAPRTPDRTRALNDIKDACMKANAAIILETVK